MLRIAGTARAIRKGAQLTYDTAVADLRELLADSTSHKRATNKKLVGPINGTNVTFYAYDKRIVKLSVEVRLDGTDVEFDVVDAVAGKIVLTEAPLENTDLRADYYWQFWSDESLKGFLNRGAQSCSYFDDSAPEKSFEQAAPGLRNAILYYAASDANRALIQYLNNRRHSEEFLLEQDGNDDTNHSETIAELRRGADSYWKQAETTRDEYYERQGRRNKPSFAVKAGTTRKYGPNR